MIRLTAQEAEDFGNVLIHDWYIIQPIEIKDGTFILPEHLIDELEVFDSKNPKKLIKDALKELKKFEKRELDESELKEESI